MKILVALALISQLQFGSIPERNQVVLDYVSNVMGSKVGTGECADLIFNAQFEVEKSSDDLPAKTGKILPGDLISFKDFVLKNGDGSETIFTDHQAIVYTVDSKTQITIAHQNHNGVMLVDLLKIDLKRKVSGEIGFSHP
jgi:hypothetical protein